MKMFVGVLAAATLALVACSSGSSSSSAPASAPSSSTTSTTTLRPADDVAAEGISAGAVGTSYTLGGVDFTIKSMKKEATEAGTKRVVVTAHFENKSNPDGTIPGMVVVCDGDVETAVKQDLSGTYWIDSPVVPFDGLPKGTFKDGVLLPTLDGPGKSPTRCSTAKLRVYTSSTLGGDSGAEWIYENPIDFPVPAGIYDGK